MERENHASLCSDATPMRDRLPTIPHDLTEYARIETGPSPQDAYDDPLRAMTAGALVDVWPTDVPCLTGAAWEFLAEADHREAFVISLLDGETSLAALLDSAPMPGTEVLAIVCELCARGVVTLDRSQRGTLLLG